MNATIEFVGRMADRIGELELWIRFLLLWNAVLTAAFTLTALALWGKLREAKEDFADAVREALK